MKIDRVQVQNIKGVESIEIAPGALVVIGGSNGTGKSSVLDAVRCVFDGGHDPGLLRRGETEGFVRLELDSGHVITKTIKVSKKNRETRTDLSIVDADGVPLPAPQAFVNDLASALAVDPARLLNPALKPGDIAKELLKVLPIEFNVEQINGIVGDDSWQKHRQKLGWLATIDKARADLYEKRRTHNVQVKELEGAADTLRRTVRGVGDGKEVEAALASKKQERADLERQLRASQQHVRDTSIADEHMAIEDYNARIAALAQEKNDRIAQIRKLSVDTVVELAQSVAAKLDALTSDIATAEADLKAHHEAEGARKLIKQYEGKLGDHGLAAEAADKAITALDALKKEKLASLPIDGLEFENDSFTVDGIPWEHVNTARKIDIALQVAVLRAGPLRFLVMDQAENLDSEGMEMLKAGAIHHGLQVIAAIVEDGPLNVKVA